MIADRPTGHGEFPYSPITGMTWWDAAARIWSRSPKKSASAPTTMTRALNCAGPRRGGQNQRQCPGTQIQPPYRWLQ